ncbi:hypothetical protein L0337_45105 [candidate division KSB1 bacterium]|nr:hypothetical protein [candidate division KSB1 bacterium]
MTWQIFLSVDIENQLCGRAIAEFRRTIFAATQDITIPEKPVFEVLV